MKALRDWDRLRIRAALSLISFQQKDPDDIAIGIGNVLPGPKNVMGSEYRVAWTSIVMLKRSGYGFRRPVWRSRKGRTARTGVSSLNAPPLGCMSVSRQ